MAEQLNQEMVKCLVPKRLQVQETIRRYQNIDKILPEFFSKKKQEKKLLTELEALRHVIGHGAVDDVENACIGVVQRVVEVKEPNGGKVHVVCWCGFCYDVSYFTRTKVRE